MYILIFLFYISLELENDLEELQMLFLLIASFHHKIYI